MSLRLLLLLAGLLVVLSGCGVPPTVKIGLVAPFEGLYRADGYEALFAVKLALQEQHQGCLVELVALNDFNDPLEAARQAKSLAADPDVVGVVGHFSTEGTLAALPVYQGAGLAVSIPWSVDWPAGTSGVVSVAAGRAEAAARLRAVARQMGFEDRAMLDEASVAASETILTRPGPFWGHVDVGGRQLTQVASEAANGLIFVSPGPDPRDLLGNEAARFREAYQALAGTPPGPRAVLTYDAAKVLLDAMTPCEQTTRPKVSTALIHVQRQGLTGPIAFDSQGRRLKAPLWIYQIEGGVYPGKLLTPP
jgi:ABC-type branched-subunit amino acid transport system substrate-binding protein